MSGTDGPRRVHVVTAGVHDAGVLGGERKSCILGDRERVDIAAQGDDRRRTIAPRHARDEPRPRDTRDIRDAE